ncbi:MAG: hypothetical protein U1E73_11020 [Planctomycetota bacterium]
MRPVSFAFAAALVLPAPAQTVGDVGLTMGGGILPVIYGQRCGAFTCQPFLAGSVGPAQPYDVTVFGAPQQVCALAAGRPSAVPCLGYQGLANMLVLTNQPITLAIGVTGTGNPIGVCNQGRAVYWLQLPGGTPSGVAFLLQAVAMSAGQGVPAFTIALRTTTM